MREYSRVKRRTCSSIDHGFFPSALSVYLKKEQRADERTRIADLLITSALSRLHRCFQVFQ